ncbi:hypothetical protein J3B02_005561, partial [Coemansia erecta]
VAWFSLIHHSIQCGIVVALSEFVEYGPWLFLELCMVVLDCLGYFMDIAAFCFLACGFLQSAGNPT